MSNYRLFPPGIQDTPKSRRSYPGSPYQSIKKRFIVPMLVVNCSSSTARRQYASSHMQDAWRMKPDLFPPESGLMSAAFCSLFTDFYDVAVDLQLRGALDYVSRRIRKKNIEVFRDACLISPRSFVQHAVLSAFARFMRRANLLRSYTMGDGNRL